MEDLQEFERRIGQALDRIGAGIEALDALELRHPRAGGEAPADDPEKAELAEALAAERDANAQLNERVRLLHEKQAGVVAPLEARVQELLKQVDEQALELQKLKATNVQLRETMRAARDEAAAAAGGGLEAELTALKAARAAELAELDSILAELKPLIGEASHA
jgi:branched-subunit amino acid aminotransferase/4-amino-4-deoxychorismate lyase